MVSGIPFGEYRLIRRLGAGGMAEVFLAKRIGPAGFEKQLVIKRILPHLAESERFTSMFLKEARLAALVDHPNLVHVSSFGEIHGEYYLAMEYVDGLTLSDLLERTGTVTPGVACRIAVETLDALHAIHQAQSPDGQPLGLVHRDVTPRNVMLTRAGAVKLLDFGIAIAAGEGPQTTMGTRSYVAPEHVEGRPVDARADLFSVGVLVVQLISGEVPFRGQATSSPPRPPAIPPELWSTVKSALQLDPELRPANARTFQRSLELFLNSRGVEGTRGHLAELVAPLVPSSGRAARVFSRLTQLGQLTRLTGTSAAVGSRRSTPLAVMAIVLGIVLVAGLGVFGVQRSRELWMTSPVDADRSHAASSESPMTTAGGAAVEMPKAGAPPEAPGHVAPAGAAASLEKEAVPESSDGDENTPRSPVRSQRKVSGVPAAPPPTRARRGSTASSTRRRRSAPRSGRLTIDTRPWTEVYLGDRRLGMTPMHGIQLPSGRHELELINEEVGLQRTIVVTIRPGRTERVSLTL